MFSTPDVTGEVETLNVLLRPVVENVPELSGLKPRHKIFTMLDSYKELCKQIHPHSPADFTQP